MKLFKKETDMISPADIDAITSEVTSGVTSFKPPVTIHRGAEETAPGPDHLQVIARAIAALTWADAEKMGDAIAAHHDGQKSLTSAIQTWAAKVTS